MVQWGNVTFIKQQINIEDFVKDTYKSIAREELEHVEKLIDIGDKYSFAKDSAEYTIWRFIVEEAKSKVANIKAKLSMID